MADPEEQEGNWRAMECMVVAFPDLEFRKPPCEMAFKLGPHLPVAWMERIILKALGHPCVRTKFAQECKLAFELASFLDSVAIVEVVLRKLFPKEMNSEAPAAGASQVVVSVDANWPWWDPLDSDDYMKDSFAWCMAFVAEEAAANGAVNVLDFALQHPLVPVAFNFRHFRIPDAPDVLLHLINHGSQHMHIVHYLLGNPLPLAPPPASRPIRPAAENLSDPTTYAFVHRLRTETLKLSRENPVATLAQIEGSGEPPLQIFSAFAITTRSLLQLISSTEAPESTAQKGKRSLVRYTMQHSNIDDVTSDGRAPLFLAAEWNNAVGAQELLDCGADPDMLSSIYDEEFDLGWTPLKLALDKQSLDVARVLLRAGATLLMKAEGQFEFHIISELRDLLLK
ncbi:hypothetical protein HDU96_000438 [Phlyctochytrium bullatum]|nr:hypothetical protein HDU96_000438 [Phlyctochytrium bullatum]